MWAWGISFGVAVLILAGVSGVAWYYTLREEADRSRPRMGGKNEVSPP